MLNSWITNPKNIKKQASAMHFPSCRLLKREYMTKAGTGLARMAANKIFFCWGQNVN